MNAVIHTELTLNRFKLPKSGPDFNFFYRLHDFMDKSKEVEATNKHRALSHHMFFIKELVIPYFGHTYTATNGLKINIKDVLELDHVLADFRNKKFPNLVDYVDLIDHTEEVENAIQDFERQVNFKSAFFDRNKEFLNFLREPYYVTGKRKALLITINSWMANYIYSLCVKKDTSKIEFVGYEPSILFRNMKDAEWINDGGEATPKINIEKIIIDGPKPSPWKTAPYIPSEDPYYPHNPFDFNKVMD